MPGDESLLDGISGTLTYEFTSVALWPALRFNKILLAFDERPFQPGPPRGCRHGLEPLWELLARGLRPVTAEGEAPMDR